MGKTIITLGKNMNLVVDEKDFLSGIFTVKKDGLILIKDEIDDEELKLTVSVANQFFNIYQQFKENDLFFIKGMFLNKGFEKVETFDEFVNHIYIGNFVTKMKELDFILLRQIHKLAYKDGLMW